MPVDMKSIIAEAFKKMVRHSNVDKITVKALIDECHISRQTFYYHFQDIMDVLEWSIQQETQRLVEQSLKMNDMKSALKIFISFTVEQFHLLQKLMDSQRRPQFENFMIDSLETYLSELVRYHHQNISVNYIDMKILLRYHACGLGGVLLACGGEANLDQDRLASQLEHIISEQLSE